MAEEGGNEFVAEGPPPPEMGTALLAEGKLVIWDGEEWRTPGEMAAMVAGLRHVCAVACEDRHLHLPERECESGALLPWLGKAIETIQSYVEAVDVDDVLEMREHSIEMMHRLNAVYCAHIDLIPWRPSYDHVKGIVRELIQETRDRDGTAPTRSKESGAAERTLQRVLARINDDQRIRETVRAQKRPRLEAAVFPPDLHQD